MKDCKLYTCRVCSLIYDDTWEEKVSREKSGQKRGMQAYGRCTHDVRIVAPQCVCLLPCHKIVLSSVSLLLCGPLASCDADQKPLKEEMGALLGAGHLRVPCRGNKRCARQTAGE